MEMMHCTGHSYSNCGTSFPHVFISYGIIPISYGMISYGIIPISYGMISYGSIPISYGMISYGIIPRTDLREKTNFQYQNSETFPVVFFANPMEITVFITKCARINETRCLSAVEMMVQPMMAMTVVGIVMSVMMSMVVFVDDGINDRFLRRFGVLLLEERKEESELEEEGEGDRGGEAGGGRLVWGAVGGGSASSSDEDEDEDEDEMGEADGEADGAYSVSDTGFGAAGDDIGEGDGDGEGGDDDLDEDDDEDDGDLTDEDEEELDDDDLDGDGAGAEAVAGGTGDLFSLSLPVSPTAGTECETLASASGRCEAHPQQGRCRAVDLWNYCHPWNGHFACLLILSGSYFDGFHGRGPNDGYRIGGDDDLSDHSNASHDLTLKT
ncbi:unnamed protein product [Cyprideis torosa]|uniref:Uncharacterized protein n=1 Tax=Cyprideis torosa TaxID=163714 RepID=A0A7R8WG43_9CRUS|nr:unnamed protein product [Cyprideis torosa]CAG0897650.1 unnamed protein product [Cyprideis torosa]